MKKFFLVLIAAIGTMMASCSKDDNEIIEPEPTPTPTPKPDPDPTPTPEPEIIISQAMVDSIMNDIFDQNNAIDALESDYELVTPEEMATKLFGPDGANGDEDRAVARQAFLKNCNQVADSIANQTGENGVPMFFRTMKFYYVTVDEKNNPLTLSAWMCWGCYWFFGERTMAQNNIVFICPYTRTKWDECATDSDGGWEKETIVFDNLFIIPDGQGFGINKNAPQTYLAHNLHAQQYYDCLVAADRLYREKGGKYESDWELRVVGASQGGGDALALHKYLETHDYEYDLTAYYNSNNAKDKKLADEICKKEGVSAGTKIIKKPLKDKWKLAYSYVCAGPYSPETTLKEYLKWGKLAYACVLPMVLKTMLAINPDLAAKYNEEDFYSDIYLKHKEEIDELLLKKTMDTEELIPHMRKLLAYDDEPNGAPEDLPLERILNQQMMDTSSEMCQDMMAALRKEDLTTGWTPTKKCYMFNCKTDDVVPYKNSELLMEFMGKLADVSNAWSSDHEGTCEEFYKKKW